jgi:hypothetical protein
MNDWNKLGCMLVASVAVFALSGCGQARASGKVASSAPSVVAASDARPTADADADNGPGCAESALDSAAQQVTRK